MSTGTLYSGDSFTTVSGALHSTNTLTHPTTITNSMQEDRDLFAYV